MFGQAGPDFYPYLIVLLGLAIFVGILILYAIAVYNNLVAKRNRYKNGFSQIDVQLKRRHDLIPNLVETVKGYMAHERGTLEAVISARNAAVNVTSKVAANPGDPESMKQLAVAEGNLMAGLGKLFALAEAYPDLKANQNMSNLQEELSSTENRVAFARQGFNDQVTDYNTYREGFPAVVFAGMFGFFPASLFELESPSDREVVQVKF
ncbi:MAG: LemA family protein [Gemmataceae bacterium]|nr:LemA family protein [Gemmataceae bacterium]